MSNVIALFEGPYWADEVEQIAQSTAGRWFSRTSHRGRMGQWVQLDHVPRKVCMTDELYAPWTRPLTKEELGPFSVSGTLLSNWRSPTPEECLKCVKGSTGALMLKDGQNTQRLPMSEAERVSLSEQRALSSAISGGSRRSQVRASRRSL